MKNEFKYFTIAFLLITSLLLGWSSYPEINHKVSQAAVKVGFFPKYFTHVHNQWKGEFKFDNGITLSNNFQGARLNDAISTDDSIITVVVSPENTPIRVNPWYAFKIWSEENKETYIKFTYPESGVTHRYYPKISSDGIKWKDLPSDHFLNYKRDDSFLDTSDMPEEALIKVSTNPDTLWIAANKIVTTKDVEIWLDSVSVKPFVKVDIIGTTLQKRPIYMVGIENDTAEKNIIILARQYPSMSVGYLAMQTFIKQITADTELARNFRRKFNVFLFPHVNPDGADNGHWSQNMEGVNLTKDWGETTQLEIKTIKTYIDSLASSAGHDFYLNIDFRSNRNSILYVLNADENNKMKGLTMDIASSVKQYLSVYQPTIKPKITSTSGRIQFAEDYFYIKYGMESLVVIIDEDSTHELIEQKGVALSMSVMEHLGSL